MRRHETGSGRGGGCNRQGAGRVVRPALIAAQNDGQSMLTAPAVAATEMPLPDALPPCVVALICKGYGVELLLLPPIVIGRPCR